MLTKKFVKEKYGWIVTLILAFVFIVSIFNAKNDSLIYDEDAHIPAGYSYLVEHDMRLNPEHPPLLKNLAALPLLFLNPKFDTGQTFWEKNPNDAQWEAGKVFLFQSGNDPDKIIFWSRVPMILLSLLLGWFIFKWTRELAGVMAGLMALILYAFDPNILGHNHYVTTDLGIAAFITMALYYFIRFIKKPTWNNVLIGSIFLGLVQLAKFSAVTIFPVMFLILIIYPLVRIKNTKREGSLEFRFKLLGKYLAKGALMFLMSLILVWGVYFVNTYKAPREKLLETTDYYFHVEDTNIKTIYTRKAIYAFNENAVTRPMANYFFGVARVFQRVAGGNVTYFLGDVSTEGSAAYFPVLFLIKEPIPILIFILFSLGIAIFNIFHRGLKNIKNKLATYLRNNILNVAVMFFIIVYSMTSIKGGLNIGFRHLFPILPLVYILVAKILFDFWKKIKGKINELIIKTIFFILLICLIIGTILAYPFYLSYFNCLAGGSQNGYNFVTDSNADWGQDLKRLKKFLEKHPEIDKIRLDYFGMADVEYYIGDKYLMWWRSKRPIEPGWYAISTLFRQESIFNKNEPNEKSYRWLKNLEPRYQVGTSILIYHVGLRDFKKIN